MNTSIRTVGCLLVLLATAGSLASEARAQTIALVPPSEQIITQGTAAQSLTDVLEKIQQRHQVSFVFETRSVQDKSVSRSVDYGERVETILDGLLPELGLRYKKIRSNTYVITANRSRPGRLDTIERTGNQSGAGDTGSGNGSSGNPVSVLNSLGLQSVQQPRVLNIRGAVTSESGEGLPGVNVLLKGTSTGTTTDVNGAYALSVPDASAGGTLVFSYIGFITQEVPISNRSVIDVVLASDVQALSEVVVVGYGTQQRRDITGAVATLSADRIKDLPVSALTESIAGQIAGVQVQQTTGAPGAGLTVRVRGTGSISAGNSPLYVVDGYPLGVENISSINPNDIASIEVLKDASAAAIYGSRGANGVVLITTKRGKAGRTRVDVDMFTGFQQPGKTIDMLNAAQFAEFSKEAFNNAWVDNGGNVNDPNSVRPDGQRYRVPDVFQNPAALGEGTDWQKEIFRTAPIQSYQVTVSGGNERNQFLFSGNYFDQQGIILNSDFKRYAFRTNLDAGLSDRIKVGLNLAPTISVENRVNSDGHWASDGVINGALSIIPSIPVYKEDGSYASQVDFGFGTPGIPSPVAIAREIDDRTTRFRILGNIYAEVGILKNLVFRTSVGTDVNLARRNRYRPSNVPANQQPAPTIPTAFSETGQDINWLNENTLNYTTSFNERHNLNVLLGYTIQQMSYEDSRLDATNFPNDLVRTLNAGIITSGRTFAEQWSLLSYLGRVNYSFSDKYLLTATIRRDGSSRFGANRRWGIFPSASAGWRISGENFMQGIPTISDLKLRASYGLTGNNSIPNYGAIGLLAADNYVLGAGTGNIVNGLAPTTISNPDLGWERTRQFDVGLDLGLFQDRVIFTADHYISNTTDLLLNVPVPSSTGFSTALQNIGKVRNTGWEFAVNSRNLTGALQWTTNLNIAFNRNEVLALGPQGDPIISGSGIGSTHITEIGQPIGNFFGYIQDGVFRDQADLDANPSFPNSRPGDVKFRDVDGDGEITPNDRTIIGNNQPDFIWGITNTLAFRGFDLNVIVQGVQGNQILNLSSRFLANLEGNQNQRVEVLDRWRSPENPGDGVTPRANSRTTGNNNNVSTRWIEDGSFLRFRNITLGYRLPQALMERIAVQSARVYIGMQNPITITRYKGYNPEVNLQGDTPLTPGTDYGGYPLARTFTLGVNIGL
jgi:TonB-dependent starch-binding outer membrane protein SusC